MSEVKVTSHKKEVLAALEKQIDNALFALGSTAEGYAKDQLYDGHGLDTGRLRNSITHAESKNTGNATYSDNIGNAFSDGAARNTAESHSVYIGTNVEYAPCVEYGSRTNSALHFLENAVVNHSDEYKRIVEAALKS